MDEDRKAIKILNRFRSLTDDMAAWNTLFDAAVYLQDRSEYQRAYDTGTLADREDRLTEHS